MLLNKKWKISLGILTATLPLITVVSCTSGVLKPQDEITNNLFNKLVSESIKFFWEKEWLFKVLDETQKDSNEKIDFRNTKELLKNEKFKELIKHFLSHELQKDVDFLIKLGLKLSDISDDKIQKKYDEVFLKEIGLKYKYFEGFIQDLEKSTKQKHPISGELETKTKMEWIADILMNEKKLDFSNNILKYFVVEQYLKTDKKNYQEFKSKFNERNYIFNQIENSIDENNFLLIKYLLKERLFFKWEIEENSNSKPNNNFLQEKTVDLIQSIKQFILTKDKKTIADFTKYSDQFKKLIKEIWDLKELNDIFKKDGINFHELIGYLGISSQESGSGKLDFDSFEELKNITDSYDWFGFLQGNKDAKDKELIKEKINFVLKGKNGHLKMILGIMPIFQNNKLTMDGTFFGKEIHKLAWLLYSNSKNNSKNIFNEAIDYFAGDKDKGGKDIKIEIKNEVISKELKEKLKLKFIK